MSMTEKLLIVQEHDCDIRDMERELKDIPARKTEEETRLDSHKQALAHAEEELKAKQVDVRELELESDSLQAKTSKLRQQQLQLKTNKEFKAMEAEIEGVAEEISKLEDRELLLMEEVEQLRANVARRSEDLKAEEASVQEDSKVFDRRAAEIEAELTGIREARDKAAEDVAAEWLARYTQVFARKDRALVPLQDGICGGCHMKLPPSVLHATVRNTEMVTCNYCGRLLY